MYQSLIPEKRQTHKVKVTLAPALYLRYSTDRQRKSKLQRSLSAKGQHLKLFKGLKSVGQDTGEKDGVKRRYYITLFGDSL